MKPLILCVCIFVSRDFFVLKKKKKKKEKKERIRQNQAEKEALEICDNYDETDNSKNLKIYKPLNRSCLNKRVN